MLTKCIRITYITIIYSHVWGERHIWLFNMGWMTERDPPYHWRIGKEGWGWRSPTISRKIWGHFLHIKNCIKNLVKKSNTIKLTSVIPIAGLYMVI